MLDYLIRNGLVVDGSGSELFKADVGIQSGKITHIGKNLPDAKEVVDARGKLVTPGFIDIHAHSELILLNDRFSRGRLAQGITTDVSGNCGIGVYPVRGEVDSLKALDADVLGKWDDWKWKDIVEYRKYVEERGLGHNSVLLQAHAPLRYAAMKNDASRAATEKEIAIMCEELDFSLSNGAKGMSSGLYYAPCIYADRKELIALLKVVKKHDAFFAVHHRCEGDSIIESVTEVLDLAYETGARLEISHLKAIGMRNQEKVDTVLSLIDKYISKGVEVLFDQYPYTFGSTSLFSLLPPDALMLSRESLREALLNRDMRERWRGEIVNPVAWDSIYCLAGDENIVPVQLDSNPQYEGLSLKEIGNEMNCDSVDALFNLLSCEKGAAVMTDVTQSDESLVKIMSSNLMCFGTDGLYSATNPHPRSYSAAIHLLKYYVREKKVLSVEEAIRRMSGEVARRLGLEKRGLIMEGCAADINILDYDNLEDTAIIGHPFDRNLGLEYVFLNGHIVVKNGYVNKKTVGVFL